MRDIKASLISLVLVLAVTGCASDVSNQMRQGGVESAQLYKDARSNRRESGVDVDKRRAQHMIGSKARYEPYTRTAMNETEQLFNLLPNPKISIHVYPHMSTRDNAPIPGYTTAVSLYKSDEYALPHELVAQGIETEVEVAPVVTPDVKTPQERVFAPEEMTREVRLIRDRNRRYSGAGL